LIATTPAGRRPPGALPQALLQLGLTAALALATGACALLPRGAADTAVPAGLPAVAEITEVPFYAQDDYQCGPATLAMALTFAGVPRTPQQLQSQVYLPERHGALQPEMLAAPRRAGLITYPLQPALGSVLREVAAGHPVIVLQNLGWEFFPQWHYALVIGYSQGRDEILLRSGATERLAMPLKDFARSWERAGRWAFVVLPPTQLPATVQEDDYLAAAASLERVAPAQAGTAYATALTRWPHNTVALIGLGNIAYGEHRLGDAEHAYRRATLTNAKSADAWNNLAQVLLETGRRDEARAAAQRAVAIGGERAAAYRETLGLIESARPR